ncbi:MAG: hypothetical protein FJ125_10560, partial [Deltaproteobacteria bacterium]|nr:hypothetical protein [Deltaproteobacteria bacterium]
LGHPLLGDLRYGSRVAPLAGAGPALCARRLRLLHPTSGEELTVEAPLPAGWPWPLPPELAEALAATGPRPRPARRPAAGRGRPAEASRPLEEPPAVLADGLEVLHLDDDLLALSKPAGLAVQRTLDPGRANLLEQAAALLVATGGARARPPALLTRLPSGASGLVLLARTRSGARAVQAQLQRRTLRRLFLLVVEGGPPPALAPGSWLEEQGCRVTVAGPVREGAFLLAVEPLSGPARAVEDLLAARGWQVRRLQGGRGDEGTAHGELRHLHRVRLHKSGQEQPLELVAPLPAAMARWCPGDESALPCFAEDERS